MIHSVFESVDIGGNIITIKIINNKIYKLNKNDSLINEYIGELSDFKDLEITILKNL